MKERENKIESTNDFDKSINQIILEMNFRRGHRENLDAENIRNKIFSQNSDKPGEYFEFIEEYEASKGKLTPGLASKMADIIYYTSQPNCPNNLKGLATEFEEKIGIDHRLAQQFCILKYRCRLEQPINSKDYKSKEYEVIKNFLNNKKLNILL